MQPLRQARRHLRPIRDWAIRRRATQRVLRRMLRRAARMVTLRPGHQVHLLQGGAELFPAMVQAMAGARHEIRLETYIFWHDEAALKIVDALVQAAERGVAVWLLADGVGTPQLPPAWARRLSQAGVRWRLYKPGGAWLRWLSLLRPSRWRRLHRKLCVIDGEIAFCGGINVLDDKIDPNHGRLHAPRFDFAVCVQGPLVSVAHEAMTQIWRRWQPQDWLRDARNSRHIAHNPSQADGHPHDGAAAGRATGSARAALLLRDNLLHRRHIERAYRRAIAAAREEIIIANAYFLPGRKLRQALIEAVRRGVQVRLLLQGRYEYFMQYHAVRTVYGTLLAAGVEIHEYSASFLHAKVAVIDAVSRAPGAKPWATVGSSNLDPLSLLLAREANVVVEDALFAADLRERLLEAMRSGGRVVAADFARRPWRQRFLDRLALGAVRLALFVLGQRY
ncbi:cardiolipin synthase ClsB [Hylemonella gracilis]